MNHLKIITARTTYIFMYCAFDPLMETVRSIYGTLVLWMDQLQK